MRYSDFSLIQAVLAGNAEAFGALVTRYQKGVYALVWSMVRDSAAVEALGSRQEGNSWLSVALVWLSGRARIFITPIPTDSYQFRGGFVWYGRFAPNRH